MIDERLISDWALKNGITEKPVGKLTNDGFDMKYVFYSFF